MRSVVTIVIIMYTRYISDIRHHTNGSLLWFPILLIECCISLLTLVFSFLMSSGLAGEYFIQFFI